MDQPNPEQFNNDPNPETEIVAEKKPTRKYKNILDINVLAEKTVNPLWLSISEAAKIGGVQSRTIRRAIQKKIINYKIIKNRYLVNCASVIKYLHSKNKLKNKLDQFGIGQYIDKWRK